VSEILPDSSDAKTQQALRACFPPCLQIRTEGLLSDSDRNTNNNQEEEEDDAVAGAKKTAQRSFAFLSFASVT